MRPFVGTCLGGLFIAAMIAAPTARARFVSFTIDDSFPGAAGVFSDSAVTGTNAYHDYRIDPAPYLNWCVDAEPYSAGNLFVRLNRKLDGDAGVLRCTDNSRPDGALGTQRNFVLKIEDPLVCDTLSDPLAGLPLTDAQGSAWGPGAQTPCILAHNDNPRIRLGTLYKRGARSTNLDFLTVMAGWPNSYEIQSQSAAAIQTNALVPGLKTVTYTGTFKLVKFEPGKKARAVGPSFTMPARMDFHEQ